MKSFVYTGLPSRVVFGAGAVKQLGAELDRLGAKRALLLCTPGRAESVQAIAKGLLEMFTDDERVILRFGMLPAAKIRLVQDEFEARFRSMGASFAEGDKLVAYCKDREIIEFSMKELVSEAVHEVSLELYRIGDLVV